MSEEDKEKLKKNQNNFVKLKQVLIFGKAGYCFFNFMDLILILYVLVINY